MVYAVVSKTTGNYIPCEFNSHSRHQKVARTSRGHYSENRTLRSSERVECRTDPPKAEKEAGSQTLASAKSGRRVFARDL